MTKQYTSDSTLSQSVKHCAAVMWTVSVRIFDCLQPSFTPHLAAWLGMQDCPVRDAC